MSKTIKRTVGSDTFFKIVENDYELQEGEVIDEPAQADPDSLPLTDEEITEYENLRYARKRALEYPPITDQLDALYHDMKNGTSTWVETIDQVKANNPKPENN